MSEVTLKINNRGYGVTCDQGQEQRLTELSYFVDSRLQDIAAAGAAANEAHLLVLTSLVIADELFDLREQVAYLEQKLQVQAEAFAQNAQQQGTQEVAFVSDVIENLADRIANISQKLKTAA